MKYIVYTDDAMVVAKKATLEEAKHEAKTKWPGCFIDGTDDAPMWYIYDNADTDNQLGTIEKE
ncbi:MAG TPA: hypothetical protein VM260_05305 [Pirellula sp.]|nr:hypothetical protein [Pirellula sp.]